MHLLVHGSALSHKVLGHAGIALAAAALNDNPPIRPPTHPNDCLRPRSAPTLFPSIPSFQGLLGGYASARLYKSFRGEEWKRTTLRTGLLFPGVCFAIFISLNMLIWGQRSSGAVPPGTLVALCFLWFGISLPLVFIGSYFVGGAGRMREVAWFGAVHKGRGVQCLQRTVRCGTAAPPPVSPGK
jgi:hypothetical protein